MGFEHELQCPTLAVEGRQQLGSAIRRRHHAMHESLERLLLAGVVVLGHARFEVPACAMVVAQSRTSAAGSVLGARHADSDIAQQVRTRNEGHRVFL
jgi:hypothetical protein